MKTDKLLLAGGIIAAATAGVLIGILLAPDRGEETRKKILEKGEDHLDELKEKLDNMIEAVSGKIEHIKKEFVACSCGEHCACKTQEAAKHAPGTPA